MNMHVKHISRSFIQPDKTSLLLLATGMTATSSTDEIRSSHNEARFTFCKGNLFNSATADRQNHVFFQVRLYDLDSEKNTQEKYMNKHF